MRAVPGVKDAVGNIFRNGATLIGTNGKPIGGNGPPTFGASWITDSGISPYHLRSGKPPTQPTDVVVDAGTAAKNGLSVGQSIAIVFQGGVEQHFTISGIAGYGSSDNLGGATIVLFSEATAAQVMDTQGKYDSILVSAESGVTDVVLRERIASALPSYAEAETGQQAAQAAEQSTEDTISTFIGTPLLVFAFISLFVGSFLIINTFNILVAQRTRELALLRALGATRAQVLRSVLIEAALTGLVASILGFAVGILIAKALLSVFGSVVDGGHHAAAAHLHRRRARRHHRHGDRRVASRTPSDADLAGRGAFRGPARRRNHCRDGASGSASSSSCWDAPRSALGCSPRVAPSCSSSAWASSQCSSAWHCWRHSWWCLSRSCSDGRCDTCAAQPALLAGENARRNPRRTALTAAALMIGLALVTMVAVLTDSLRVSTDDAIEGAFRSSFIVFTRRPGLQHAGGADAFGRPRVERRHRGPRDVGAHRRQLGEHSGHRPHESAARAVAEHGVG